MKDFDVFNIPEKVEKNIKKKINSNPDFQPNILESKSKAAKAICEWVRGISEFTDVNKEINEKKTKVEAMDKELEKQNSILAVK